MLSFSAMRRLTAKETHHLKMALAGRTHSAAVLGGMYGLTRAELEAFVEEHRESLEGLRQGLSEGFTDAPTAEADTDVHGEPSPSVLAELWITNKSERLRRMQEIADIAYADLTTGALTGAELATSMREFRSYIAHAANELGQLLHRGAGDIADGDSMVVEINGIDMDRLK